MAYAAMRAAKCGAGGVGAAANHHENRQDLPNADPELRWLNKAIVGSGNVWEDVNNRLNEAGITPRKNACLAVEFVVTASPEFYNVRKVDSEQYPDRKTISGNKKSMIAYEQASIDWFKKTYGAENVVCVNRHVDEKTPHLHIFVVPIVKKAISLTRQRKGQPMKPRRTETKTVLSATHMMGGPKQMAEMQTKFAEAVAHLGLDRGIAGTGARHTTTRQYGALTAAAVSGDNMDMVKKAVDLLGNRRDRIERSELQEMKAALATSGMQIYKGKVMSIADAKSAQDVEQAARAARKVDIPAEGPKTPQTPVAPAKEAEPKPAVKVEPKPITKTEPLPVRQPTVRDAKDQLTTDFKRYFGAAPTPEQIVSLQAGKPIPIPGLMGNVFFAKGQLKFEPAAITIPVTTVAPAPVVAKTPVTPPADQSGQTVGKSTTSPAPGLKTAPTEPTKPVQAQPVAISTEPEPGHYEQFRQITRIKKSYFGGRDFQKQIGSSRVRDALKLTFHKENGELCLTDQHNRTATFTQLGLDAKALGITPADIHNLKDLQGARQSLGLKH